VEGVEAPWVKGPNGAELNMHAQGLGLCPCGPGREKGKLPPPPPPGSMTEHW